MAEVYVERSYIESYDEEDSHMILVHIKDENTHIYAGKVELDRDIPWIHLDTAKNGDLLINNSAGMEDKKWDHITREIIGDIQ
jgi:hypothetical protein